MLIESYSKTIKYIVVFIVPILIVGVVNYFINDVPVVGDDIWGATAIQGNPFEVIVFTLRWDLHPFLYYSFLDIWAIFSHSDFWLRSSSTFLHALLVLGVFAYVSKEKGNLEAFIASILVFSSPYLLVYSTSIRMYSLIALLSFLQFVLVQRYTNNDKYLKWVAFNAILISYIHAIGLLFVFFHFCYGLSSMSIRESKAEIKKWIICHGLVALAVSPVVINSALKSVSHAGKPTFETIIKLFEGLFVSGNHYLSIIPLLLILWSLKYRSERKLIVIYFLLPIVIFAGVSYLVKPLWLTRNFVFCLPLVCIAIASVIARMNIKVPVKYVIPVGIALINLYSWSTSIDKDHSNNFALALNDIKQELHATDAKLCVISDNHLNVFWSLERYLNGTDWGDPMNTQPPINERWEKISRKLPESISKLLALEPTPNFTENNKLILASGYSSRCSEPDVTRTLLIAEKRSGDKNYDVFYENTDYVIYNMTKNGGH